MLNLGKYELGPIRLAAVAIPTFFKNENCPNCCCNVYTGIVHEFCKFFGAYTYLFLAGQCIQAVSSCAKSLCLESFGTDCANGLQVKI